MISKLESLGTARLYLEVRPDNQSAIRLYEKAGFTVCKQLPNYYGPNHPAQRMVRKK
jgi:ribosomal protein S18 acetylase RimI-like enzyme